MSAVTLPLLSTATGSARLSPTSTTSSLLGTPAISPQSLNTPATSLFLSTPAIPYTSSSAEISQTIIPKPSSSQIFTAVSMRQDNHFSSFNSKVAMLSSTELATSENAPDHFSILPRTAVDVIISTARSMSAATLPFLTATTHASLSPTSTTSSLLGTPAISPQSLNTPATSLFLSTPAIPYTSSSAEISQTIIPKPSSSQIFTAVSMRQDNHFSSFNSEIVVLSSTELATSENVPDHFSIPPRTANASRLPSVSSSSFGGGNMEGSFSVSTVGIVAGVGGSFLLAVIIVVLVMTVLLLLRRRKKKYFVSTDIDENTLHNPLYGDLRI